jgi:hypothetical protein
MKIVASCSPAAPPEKPKSGMEVFLELKVGECFFYNTDGKNQPLTICMKGAAPNGAMVINLSTGAVYTVANAIGTGSVIVPLPNAVLVHNYKKD